MRSHQGTESSNGREEARSLVAGRRCCVLLLLLLGLSAAAAANNRYDVASSAVRSALILSFTLCVCTPRALAYVNAQPPRQGVVKRTIGGSLARSWPPPLSRHRRCCVLLLLPLGLSAAANNRCLLYTSPSPRDLSTSRMPSSA